MTGEWGSVWVTLVHNGMNDGGGEGAGIPVSITFDMYYIITLVP